MGALSLDHATDLFDLDPRSAARMVPLDALRLSVSDPDHVISLRRRAMRLIRATSDPLACDGRIAVLWYEVAALRRAMAAVADSPRICAVDL